VLLTRRTAHLAQHAGQISFPGGRCEPEESAEAAALRECTEETGLAASHVQLVGRLSHWVTITRYRVTPVVGLVTPGFSLAPQADEVDEIFELPLSVALDPARYIERAVNLPGQRLTSHAIRWEGRLIWGATAGMLRMLWQTLDSPAP
jgi:8-oxo-dGTP pyrophosphatase MutT (NUDIX family)